MNRQVKKTLKISGITLGTVLLVLLVAIAFVINFIVTPKKLTPVVLDAANQTLNAPGYGERRVDFLFNFPTVRIEGEER